MKGLKTIKSRPGGAARFRGVVAALPHRSFSSAVGDGFSEWVARRWGPVATRPPSRAQRSFLKRRNPAWPLIHLGDRAVTLASYKLFASLRLAVDLSPLPLPPHASPAAAPVNAATTLLVVPQVYRNGGGDRGLFTRESSATFRLLSEHVGEVARGAGAGRTLSVHFGGCVLAGVRLAQTMQGARAKGGAPRPPSAARSAPLRLPGVSSRWTQLFNGNLIASALWQGGASLDSVVRGGAIFLTCSVLHYGGTLTALKRVLRGGVTTITLNGVLPQGEPAGSPGLILRQGGAAWHTLLLPSASDTPTAARGRRTPILLKALRGELGATHHGAPPTLVQLTFAAPKPPDTQAGVPCFSRFSPSPPLRYVRQGASQAARGVAEALRDLRQAIGEIKGSAAAAPAPRQVEYLTRQVLDQLERELRIEKERRGL